jgi:hypothetical protein
MASRTHAEYTCDRCGKEQPVLKGSEIWSWGKIWYSQNNGPIYTKKDLPDNRQICHDLCEECLGMLSNWFKFGKST